MVDDGKYVVLSVESTDDDSIDLTVDDTVLALDLENNASCDVPEIMDSLCRQDTPLEMVSDKFDTTSTDANRRTIMILSAQSKTCSWHHLRLVGRQCS